MERPENIENIVMFPFLDDYSSIYIFFCKCEENSTIVTIPMIRDKFFHGDYWPAYEHVQRFWRWFLVRIDDKGYPYRFRVSGIMLYPQVYFVNAHKPEHMQFFCHFVESMKAYDEREKAQRARRGNSMYRNLTLTGLDEQIDKQQPMPEIVIPVDEADEILEGAEGEQLINKGNIDVVWTTETNASQLLENDAPLPIIADPPDAPLPPSLLSRLFAWIVLGSIAVVVVISLVYLLLNRRE